MNFMYASEDARKEQERDARKAAKRAQLAAGGGRVGNSEMLSGLTEELSHLETSFNSSSREDGRERHSALVVHGARAAGGGEEGEEEAERPLLGGEARQ